MRPWAIESPVVEGVANHQGLAYTASKKQAREWPAIVSTDLLCMTSMREYIDIEAGSMSA
jgi:hypothetical protein